MEEISRLKASQKAHRAHLTQIFGRIDDILQSNAIPDEKQTATLRTSLEQVEMKKATVEELDMRISEAIQDPEVLESEILDAEEVQYNITEKITLIREVLVRPKPLNIQATLFQPQHVQALSEPLTDQQPPPNEDVQPSREEGLVTNTPQNEETRDDSRTVHVEPTQEQRYANTFTSIPQNVSRLPKLTLPIFEGDPLSWQIFWDLLNLLCIQIMC